MAKFNRVIHGDTLEQLPRLPAGCADVVFADPPFNIGIAYAGDCDDRRRPDDYLDWSRRWITACHRILKPGGAFFLAIGDDYAAELKIIATREVGFVMRNWIIWHYRFGQNARSKFARAHTHIFYFAVDAAKHAFQADAVRVLSDRQKNYADRRAYNTLGKIPDDVWDEFPRVCGTFTERAGDHPCQMPEALLARIIRACSVRGNLVVDPFAGSGTTLVVARKLGRRYLGIDCCREYVDLVRRRLSAVGARRRRRVPAWPDSDLEALTALWLESGVGLERLVSSPYLLDVFARQFEVRIEGKRLYSAAEIAQQLQALRRANKLPKTLVYDVGRTYGSDRRPSNNGNAARVRRRRLPAQAELFR